MDIFLFRKRVEHILPPHRILGAVHQLAQPLAELPDKGVADFRLNPFYEITNSIASLWFARSEIKSDVVVMNADVYITRNILSALTPSRGSVHLGISSIILEILVPRPAASKKLSLIPAAVPFGVERLLRGSVQAEKAVRVRCYGYHGRYETEGWSRGNMSINTPLCMFRRSCPTRTALVPFIRSLP